MHRMPYVNGQKQQPIFMGRTHTAAAHRLRFPQQEFYNITVDYAISGTELPLQI